MDEKVVLTQEQADTIEYALSDNEDCYCGDKDTLIREVANPCIGFHNNLNLLNKMDIALLSKSLYIGYEVEPSIKIGDFVDIGLFGISKIAEVTGVKGNAIAINGSEEYHEFKINRVLTDEEKQEEKQRRWWAKHNRDVWELKVLDKVRISSVEYEVTEVCQKGVYKVQTNEYVPFDSIYVTNDQSKIGGKDKIELIDEKDKVVCFREDRKDV